MIIKLTNASKEFDGKKFLLNSDEIVSVFEGTDNDGKKAIFIYGKNKDTWQIKETLVQVERLLS